MRIILTLCLSFLVSTAMADHHIANLILSINGFSNDKGVARIAITNSRRTFEAQNDDPLPFRKASISIHHGKARLVIDALPKGEYAIKVYHDENSNNELDLSPIGLPTEEFGFSNDAMGRYGPPDFEQAKFLLRAPRQEIRIQMHRVPGF